MKILKSMSSFSFLLRYAFHRCCGSSGIATLLCLKSRNSGETRSAKAKKRKTLVFIDFNIYMDDLRRSYQQNLQNLQAEIATPFTFSGMTPIPGKYDMFGDKFCNHTEGTFCTLIQRTYTVFAVPVVSALYVRVQIMSKIALNVRCYPAPWCGHRQTHAHNHI